MARVPVITPKIAPSPNQERFQRAPSVNPAPIVQGIGAVAGAFDSLKQQQDRRDATELAELQKREREELQFQSIRRAQNSYRTASRTVKDGWAEISQTSGARAESAVSQFDALADAERQRILESTANDPEAQVRAISEFDSVTEVIRAKAQAHARAGRVQSIDNQTSEMILDAEELAMIDPDNPKAWSQLAGAVDFRLKEKAKLGEDISDAAAKEAHDAARKAMANTIVKNMLAKNTPEGIAQAEAWVSGKGRSGLFKGTAHLDLIRGQKDAMRREVDRQMTDADNKLAGELQDIKSKEGTVAYIAAVRARASEFQKPENRSHEQVRVDKIEEALDAARAKHSQSQQELLAAIVKVELTGTSAEPRTVKDYAALNITNMDIVAKAIGEQATTRIKERGTARDNEIWSRTVDAFTDSGGDISFLDDKRLEEEGASLDVRKAAASLREKTVLGRLENAQAIRSAREAEYQKFTDDILRAKQLVKFLGPDIRSVRDLPIEYSAGLHALTPEARKYVENQQEAHFNSLTAPSAWSETLKGYMTSGPKNKSFVDKLLDHVVTKKGGMFGMLNDTELTPAERSILSGAVYDEAKAYMEGLEKVSGRPATSEDLIQWFDTRFGDVKDDMMRATFEERIFKKSPPLFNMTKEQIEEHFGRRSSTPQEDTDYSPPKLPYKPAPANAPFSTPYN